MSRRGVVNAIGWTGLALGVPAVVVALGPERGASTGHDAAGCRPCRSAGTYLGTPLPFEIDGRNVRPGAAGDDAPGPRVRAGLTPRR